MPFEEIEDKSAADTVTTLPILYVVVTEDTNSGDYHVSGSYMVTSGIIAKNFVYGLRELYENGLESLRQDVSVGSANEDQQQSQGEGQGQQRRGRTREDIESSFDTVFPVWKARKSTILRTSPGIHYRSAHVKALHGTQWKIVTAEEWETERAGLDAGTLITQCALDGKTLESTVHVTHAGSSSQERLSEVETTRPRASSV